MNISYNWLKDYIPGLPGPEELSKILTSVGLEVEDMHKYEEIKGSLKGLIIGEVIDYKKHQDADKLKITEVNVGDEKTLQIVCGASNVAIGQKVIVAPVDSVIYPINGEPVTIKKVKIRGVESNGMICAEDEIGIGTSHEGIITLPIDSIAGTDAASFYTPYNDWIFEIGLTPNRMDAMSHIGVAKDICAYLSHHNKKNVKAKIPVANFKADNDNLLINVLIENSNACERYAGVTITNVKVQESPKWLQQKLKSIGLRPLNNIVDITNYILHDTGQPLHAFNADAIKGNTIIVKNLPEGTAFITLDEKGRKLNEEDIMICNGASEPMCFGGVFGGLNSGVKDSTDKIFLESAWFNPLVIRKTSLRQQLRTDAATRFEKGVDISQTVNALARAAMMVKDIACGKISCETIDVYPKPKQKTKVALQNSYLKKLSGKEYSRNAVKNILQSLDFEIKNESADELQLEVPFSKIDITLPADIVEEVMRIDGFDNVEIPSAITIAPSIETDAVKALYKEKILNYLTGSGFSEIFTNSITNSAYYDEPVLKNTVRIINSLSEDLDIMRPSLMETGLECIAYNLNRKNNNLFLFEFGNSYSTTGIGQYNQEQHLCLYVLGNKNDISWKGKPAKADFYFLKGICKNIFTACGLNKVDFTISKNNNFEYGLSASVDNEIIAETGMINKHTLQKFSIRQEVIYANIFWDKIEDLSKNIKISYTEIPKFPAVYRDLSIVINKHTTYSEVENIIADLNIDKLINVKLFDVFESEKLGIDKKAFAISFTFLDSEKTLTDKETDALMNKIIVSFERQLNAEIRK